MKYGDLKQTNLTLSWWFLFAVDFQGKWGTGIPNWMARSRTIVLVESFISTSVWRPGRVAPCDPFFPTYVMNGNLRKKNNLSSTKNSKGNDFTFIFVLIEKIRNCPFLGAHLRLVDRRRQRIPEAHPRGLGGTCHVTGGDVGGEATWKSKIFVSGCDSFGLQVLSAVTHIHANGIIHLDIKSQNIMPCT